MRDSGCGRVVLEGCSVSNEERSLRGLMGKLRSVVRP